MSGSQSFARWTALAALAGLLLWQAVGLTLGAALLWSVLIYGVFILRNFIFCNFVIIAIYSSLCIRVIAPAIKLRLTSACYLVYFLIDFALFFS